MLTSNETVGFLDQLREAVERAGEKVQALCAEQEQAQAQLRQGFDPILEEMEAIRSLVEELDADAARTATEVGERCEGVKTEVDALGSEAEQALSATEEAGSSCEEELTGAGAEFRSQRETAGTAINQLTETVQQQQESISRSRERHDQVSTNFRTALKAQQSLLEVAHRESEEALRRFQEDLGADMQPEMESAFEDFEQTAEEVEEDSLLAGLGEMSSSLGALLEGFSSLSLETASAWAEEAVKAISDVAEHILDTLLDAIREGFRELVEEVIKEMIEEMVEQAAMMAIGAEVTAVLGPLLPELAAAKLLLGAINDFLDAIGIGDGD